MHLPNRIGSLFLRFILICSFGCIGANAQGQIQEEVEQHKDFNITSSISLGLTGPSYKTEFKLVDELGLPYDAISLATDPGIAKTVALTDEQVRQIRDMKKAVTKELEARISEAIVSDEGRQAIEARFREVEAEARNVMTDEQLELLEQAKIQRGFERFGMPKYMATQAMRDKFNLNDDDLETIKAAHVESYTQHSSRIKSMARLANEALIAELSEAQKRKFEEALKGEDRDEFLDSKLFNGKRSLRHANTDYARAQLRQLRIKRLRTELKIDDQQYAKVQSLLKQARQMSDEKLKSELQTLLTEEQRRGLNRYGIKSETTRYGTVNEMSRGLLSQVIGLSEEESEDLYEAGKEIFDELNQDIRDSKDDALQETLGSLSKEQQEQIIARLKNATIFK